MKEKRNRPKNIKRRHMILQKNPRRGLKENNTNGNAESKEEVNVTLCSGSSSSQSPPTSPSISSLASIESSSSTPELANISYCNHSIKEQHKMVANDVPRQIISSDIIKDFKSATCTNSINSAKVAIQNPICSTCLQYHPERSLFKCNGCSCSNLFHLSCIDLPPNCRLYRFLQRYQKYHCQKSSKQIVDIMKIHPSQQAFLCSSCDVQGSSQFLMEYLEPFHTIPPSQDTEIRDCSEIQPSRILQIFQHYVNRKKQNHIQKKTENKNKPPKHSSNNSLHENSHVKDNKPSNHKPQCSTHIFNPLLFKENESTLKDDQMEHTVTPSIFVGQPIQIYCPIDNSYHLGRIIDWRIQSNLDQRMPLKSKQSTPQITQNDQVEVDQYEFLVRFRAGIDERKVALHQWIRLEDHAVIVGILLVWIRLKQITEEDKSLDNKSTKNKKKKRNNGIKAAENTPKKKLRTKTYQDIWRPAQVVLRSGLEMSSINGQMNNARDKKKNREHDKSQKLFAFALFFGEETTNVPQHAMINLMSPNAISFHPPISTISSVSRKNPIPSHNLDQKPPNRFHNKLDRSSALSVAMAYMENQEQILIRQLLHLPVNFQHYFREGLDSSSYVDINDENNKTKNPRMTLSDDVSTTVSSSLHSILPVCKPCVEGDTNDNSKNSPRDNIKSLEDQSDKIVEVDNEDEDSLFETESEEDSSDDDQH